jgi:hypothetical protein
MNWLRSNSACLCLRPSFRSGAVGGCGAQPLRLQATLLNKENDATFSGRPDIILMYIALMLPQNLVDKL